MANESKELIEAAQVLLGADDKGGVKYQVNGDEVKLSFNIVRRYLTRGAGQATDSEVIQFIFLCKANGLNPFTGDCYMIKSDKMPATMVIARDAFMRRAESAVDVYQGFESGVIVIRGNEVVELPGSFFIPGKEQLVGGWARVYRSDRKVPTYMRVSLQEYNTGKSNWAGKPGTMIQKVAEAQAFRKAFPNQVGGLYTPEEIPDEQTKLENAQASIENSQKPLFIDREAPEFTPDPEPAEVTDPEPSPALKELMKEEETDEAPKGLFEL